MTEPFFLSFEQIAKLTDYQMAAILYHPRDEDGGLDFRPPGPRKPISFGDLLRKQAARRGEEPASVEAKMAERRAGQFQGISEEELKKRMERRFGGSS